jgi:DNA processing protein
MLPLTTNTKAVLLLTAPLIVGRHTPAADTLTPSEYKGFALRLHEIGYQPADLLGPDDARIIGECGSFIAEERLQRLLGRGLQLAQAVDRWQQRAIWVISRADLDYPKRLKVPLKGQAPALLYGCGDIAALDNGGLAVVGSRNVDEDLVDYAIDIGSLAARADRSIISGGAKGIDQAAMRGALEAGGRACGVLADSLERHVMTREHRDMLLAGQLVLVSPYDPNAGFNAGNAMQRNKLIYALADAALVVSSDVEKGGTWAGAIEQLRKLKLTRVYVRSTGTPQRGLDALKSHGALPWPNPATPDELRGVLDAPAKEPADMLLSFEQPPNNALATGSATPALQAAIPVAQGHALPETEAAARDGVTIEPPSERLFAAARLIIIELARRAMKDAEFAEALGVPKPTAKAWLDRLVQEGALQKQKKPAGYVISPARLL